MLVERSAIVQKILESQPTVIRTERGLSIAGTRITLYDVMDYVEEEWPPSLIRQWLDLTEQQMADVLTYIEEHHDEVEVEYQQVLAYAAELRQYWDERNRERFTQIAALPPPPGKEEPWARLQAKKAKLVQE
jgi:uncharacterized protein (DUF433 family)